MLLCVGCQTAKYNNITNELTGDFIRDIQNIFPYKSLGKMREFHPTFTLRTFGIKSQFTKAVAELFVTIWIILYRLISAHWRHIETKIQANYRFILKLLAINNSVFPNSLPLNVLQLNIYHISDTEIIAKFFEKNWLLQKHTFQGNY